MPRGETSEEGDTRVAPNGYHYIRAKDKWRLHHHVIAEETILKRPLRPDESVRFRDGNRDNLHPDNLAVVSKGSNARRQRLARVIQRISELETERDLILKELASNS